jgi:hypothetical protein
MLSSVDCLIDLECPACDSEKMASVTAKERTADGTDTRVCIARLEDHSTKSTNSKLAKAIIVTFD